MKPSNITNAAIQRPNRLLSIRAFREEYGGPGRTKIYALLNSGELRAVKIGRRTYIREEDALQFIAGLEQYQRASELANASCEAPRDV